MHKFIDSGDCQRIIEIVAFYCNISLIRINKNAILIRL